MANSMQWRPVEVQYPRSNYLGDSLSSLGLEPTAEANHKAFLQTPELREATKLHQDSIPTSKIQFNEDVRSEARRVSGKVVDIETAMNGEVSVFQREVEHGVEVLLRSDSSGQLELLRHADASTLLGAVASEGRVGLLFD